MWSFDSPANILLKALVDALVHCKSLRRLSLFKCQIGDTGAVILLTALVEENDSIEELDLGR